VPYEGKYLKEEEDIVLRCTRSKFKCISTSWVRTSKKGKRGTTGSRRITVKVNRREEWDTVGGK